MIVFFETIFRWIFNDVFFVALNQIDLNFVELDRLSVCTLNDSSIVLSLSNYYGDKMHSNKKLLQH